MADENSETREQSGSASETRQNPGAENGSKKRYDNPVEVWDDPPEWMENIQDDGGELIPLGARSRSLQRAYISIRQGGGISISQKAMYKYFNDSEGVAIAVKSPQGGGSKKLYLRPINDLEKFPLGKKLKRRSSGGGDMNVGQILDDYNLIPDEATKYELEWEEETGSAVVNFSKDPVID